MGGQVRSFLISKQVILLPYAAMLILLIVMSVLRPGFGLGSVFGIRSLASEAAVFAVVALGQTLVIVSGGIDLSVPWVLNGGAILLTYLTAGDNAGLWWVVPLLLCLGFAVGATSGFLISVLQVPPVVITLGMNVFLAGAIAGIIQGNAAGKYGATPPLVREIVRARTLEIPNLLWIALILVIVLGVLMDRTAFGRRLYAMGTNPTVALLSGVRPRRVTVVAYGISALMSTIAGILIAGKLGSVTLGIGDTYLFTSVAVVAIGGTSILGGSGNVVGTFGGACLLAVATASIPVLGVPDAFTFIIFGLIILAAVTISTSGRLLRG